MQGEKERAGKQVQGQQRIVAGMWREKWKACLARERERDAENAPLLTDDGQTNGRTEAKARRNQVQGQKLRYHKFAVRCSSLQKMPVSERRTDRWRAIEVKKKQSPSSSSSSSRRGIIINLHSVSS